MMPSYPHTLLVTDIHCQQAPGKYVGHTESSLGVGKAKLKAEIQTDDNAS